MLKKLFQFVKFILSVYFIYFFIDFTIKNLSELKIIFSGSILSLFIIIFLKISIILLNSIIFRKILETLNITINFSKANELTILNYLGNLVGPFKLGAGMRIEYLRQNFNMSVKDFIIKNFSFTFYCQLIYISIFIFALFLDKKLILSYTFSLILIFLTVLFLLNKKILFGKENLFTIKEFLKSFLINFSILTLFLLGVWVVILEVGLVIGVSYQLLKGIYIFEGISLTNIANLTPANLGIREFALLSIDSLHNLSLNNLITIGILDRFCSLFSTFLMFLIQNIKKTQK